MKAWVLCGIGDFRLEEVDEPVLKEKEVLVAVKAAGICGSDIPRVYRTGTYSYPAIPGHEFSGLVVKAGPGADPGWLGRRVGVFPLIPCGNCTPCRRKRYEMCRHYGYLGSRQDGGFAEYVAVPQWNLIGLPDGVTYEQAAMLEPMSVAVHAVRTAYGAAWGSDANNGANGTADSAQGGGVSDAVGEALGREAPVAICGLGAIGLLLAMFLLEAGHRNLLVIGNKGAQRERVLRMGLPEANFCDSKSTDVLKWVHERTGSLGAGIFFECVGRNETITMAVDATAPGGIVQLVGNPASDIILEKNCYWKILRNQLTVKGCWNSSFTHEEKDDWHYVLDRVGGGRVAPEQLITQKFGFGELGKGFLMMRDKSQEYVKVMVAR